MFGGLNLALDGAYRDFKIETMDAGAPLEKHVIITIDADNRAVFTLGYIEMALLTRQQQVEHIHARTFRRVLALRAARYDIGGCE